MYDETTTPKQSSTWYGKRLLLTLGMAALLLLSMLAWLGYSESGLTFLCKRLPAWSANRLHIDSPKGQLLGEWHAQSLRWNDDARDIEVRQVSLVLAPRELLRGQLVIERIEAASLRIASTPNNTPTTLPADLQLPFSLRIAHLALGRVTLGQAGEKSAALVEAIDAALDSDGRTHRLEHLSAHVGKLALSADATLDGKRPFALKAQAKIKSAAFEQPFTMTLHGDGYLDRIRLAGSARAEPRVSTASNPAAGSEQATAAQINAKQASPAPLLTGDLQALLTPFAQKPFANLRAQLHNLDPAAIVADAPQALLDVDASLQSTSEANPQSTASGYLRMRNHRSGSLDRNLLPLQTLQTQLDWHGTRLDLRQLTFALGGGANTGGELGGSGSFDAGRLDLDLVATRVNVQTLHSGLMPTRLSGPLHASLDGDNQTLDLDLRDARYTLSAKASRTASAIEMNHVRLASGDARLDAKGQLALTGKKSFSVLGTLKQFDPGRFVSAVDSGHSLINADFDLRGTLDPTPNLLLQFMLANSHLGGKKLAGRGQVDLSGKHLRKVDIDLEAAGNRLNARGSFGRPGQTLRLNLQAPALEAFGWANLAGDAKGHFILSGSVAEPAFGGELTITRLRLAESFELNDVALTAQLDAGPNGALAAKLRCASCALPGYGLPPMTLDAKVQGSRRQHQATLRAVLPDKNALRLAANGGLTATKARTGDGTSLSWRGSLDEMRLGKSGSAATLPLLRLVAAAPLHLSTTALSFGPARFDGEIGNLDVERLRREQNVWQSTGLLRQFRPEALLTEFSTAYRQQGRPNGNNPKSLQLDGEWDITLDMQTPERNAGRAALWRKDGDLVIGPVALGLSDARIEATLEQGRIAMNARLRGAQLGDVSAELKLPGATAANDAGGIAALVDMDAPLRGQLHLSIPDLSWIGPLLDKGWQVAGQLRSDMQVEGTLALPQLRGGMQGNQLALRGLDGGIRLERGQAQLELTPERLLLRRLSFDSMFQPLPRVLALDKNINVQNLTGTPGRIEASGELPLASSTSGDARLEFHLDRVGVLQAPDQWIALSGTGTLRVNNQVLDISGKLRADAGFWSLGQAGKPQLSNDVVILPSAKERAGNQDKATERGNKLARSIRLDLDADLGRSFNFRGAGVESRLGGKVRIQSGSAGLMTASGTIRTADGLFDAYGKKLEIERGIVNFQGPIDNPGLNIRAVRQNLPVEVGVEVTGTAQRPLINLVSSPAMPDAEKLSWLVLGRPPSQQDGGDRTLLIAASQTIFAGQDGGVLRQLQQGLGIDEFGVSTGELGGSGYEQSSRIASINGFGGSQSASGQIVSVGKRLSANAMISYEQALNTADSVVKLTVNLSRRFSVVGRAGSESAIDFFWRRSYGGARAKGD